jgi:hypothetical protein
MDLHPLQLCACCGAFLVLDLLNGASYSLSSLSCPATTMTSNNRTEANHGCTTDKKRPKRREPSFHREWHEPENEGEGVGVGGNTHSEEGERQMEEKVGVVIQAA